jgi:hypothetical protein
MSDTEQQQTNDPTGIRPFRIDVTENELVELRRRILATRWPEHETVANDSQGVPLAMAQEVAHHWATEYDWRKWDARLNALPQFMTEIDGVDVHFIHVRSKHENALPLIVTHGWPGSVIEQLKIINPLTNPTALRSTTLFPFGDVTELTELMERIPLAGLDLPLKVLVGRRTAS